MNPCDAFRRALEATLSGAPHAVDLTVLGWHEHLVGCGECRTLLEQEEALELLLTSLPEPALPEELTSRVLARLRQKESLDRLLDLDEVVVPVNLSARIRAGLQEESLDRLLDRAGTVEVPAGLEVRVLEGVRAEQVADVRRARFHVLRTRIASAAAILVVGAGLWIAGTGNDASKPTGDEAVIAWLPALEYWEEVKSLDPLEARLVLEFDEVDQALLEEDG